MKKQSIKVVGRLRIRVYENDKLIQDWTSKNMTVNGGLDNACGLLAGDVAAGFPISDYKAGTNGTAPALPDANITGAFSKAIAGYSYPATAQVNFNFTMEKLENNGMTIAEWGLFNSNGVMCCRVIEAPPILKVITLKLVGDWLITYSN